ncbi:MAG: DM13 domain-containing protein [Candidatus Peribacteraceae bacterium]|jgi:hypothetical protein|nr:DM13 domain-containing protein [Candidatus Peribacteraceae bacterium]MDP7477470.1 DM13 domain-containing protein [Candidatus Peribacteraceae bacterium]
MSKRLLIAVPALLLAACTQVISSDPDIGYLIQNPLFAERYAEEMVDGMVNLEIYEDPILEDGSKQKVVDATKEEWLRIAKDARKAQRRGFKGGWTPVKVLTEGEVLYLDNVIYFDSQFDALPGPSVHVFLSKMVDPREEGFPDEYAMDLGEMKTAYGAQRYSVPEVENPIEYNTVVLWDKKLEMLYTFSQLSPMNDVER